MINYLRGASHSSTYAASMPAPVAQQIISSMSIIMGEDGTKEGTTSAEFLLGGGGGGGREGAFAPPLKKVLPPP